MSPAPDEPPGYHDARRQIEEVPRWFHRIEVLPGLTTPGGPSKADSAPSTQAETLARLPLPDRCDGLRVLDIGARDGFFSFELERRGADVLAIDHVPAPSFGFDVAKRLLRSRVEFRVENVYDLDPAVHGTFDIVLFLGVLYHLRNPLLALDRIYDVCSATAQVFVETRLLDEAFRTRGADFEALQDVGGDQLAGARIMQFHPHDTLDGDHSNWWVPSSACLRSMLEAAGFEVDYLRVHGFRGVARAIKVEDDRQQFYRQVEMGKGFSYY